MSIEKKNTHPAGTKPAGKFRKGGMMKRKVCRFCTDKIEIDYKNVSLLRCITFQLNAILQKKNLQ